MLTPEDVVNKRFTVTKFREGYDQDEVDDFLDTVVVEFRRLVTENEELRAQLAGKQASAGEPAPEVTAFPTQLPTLTPDPQDTTNSHSLLQLARKLHEEHVREGLTKRDQLIRDGQENASRIVREAETQARSIISQLELDRKAIENTIDELRDFENDYRSRLREYIESQLETLIREESFEASDLAYEAVITPEIAAAQQDPETDEVEVDTDEQEVVDTDEQEVVESDEASDSSSAR